MDSGPNPPSSKSNHSSKDVAYHSPRKLVISSIDSASFVSSTSKSYKSPILSHDKSKGAVPSKMNQILAAQQDNISDALHEMNDKYKYQIAAWRIYYFITLIRLRKLKKLNIKLLNTNNYNTSLLDKCYKKTKLLSLTIQHQTEEMGRMNHAKEELQETMASVRTNYENVISDMRSNFDVKVEELSLLQSFQRKHKNDMQILVEVNSKIKYELDVNKDACKDLVLEAAQLKSEMELLNQRNNITLQHVQELESIILKQNELVEQLTASLSNQKSDSEVRVGKYEEHISLLEKRLSAAASNEEVLNNEIAKLKNDVTELKSNLNQSKVSNDRINNEKALVNNAMAVMVETMNEQKVKLDQHTKTIQKLRDEIKYLSKSKRNSSQMSSVRDKTKDISGDTDEDQEGNIEGANTNTTSEYHESKNSFAADVKYENDVDRVADRVAWEIRNRPFNSNSIQKLDDILENTEVVEEKNSNILSEVIKNSSPEKNTADDSVSRRESSSDRGRSRSSNDNKSRRESSSDDKSRRESSSDNSRSRSSNDNKSRRESSSDHDRKGGSNDDKSRRESSSDHRRSSGSNDDKSRRESSSDNSRSRSSNDSNRDSGNTDRGREKNRKSTTSNSPDSSPHLHRGSNVSSSKSKTEEIKLAPEMD